jgi:hypothetical protein
VYPLDHLFIYWPLPQFLGNFGGNLVASALKKILYEFDIGFIEKYCRKLFVRSGIYAVGAVVTSINDLNVFHGRLFMRIGIPLP